LEDQACQHDVLPEIATAFCVGGRGNSSTSSLENKTDEIAGAEEESISAGLEAGEVLAVKDDDA